MSDISYPDKVSGNQVTAPEINQIKTAVNSKVDKVTGKGLSTNDYTDEDKEAVANIGSGGTLAGTETTFNGTIKFDTILGRYATVNSSDISGPITVDFAGAVPLGCYYLIVVEDGGGAPSFSSDFKFAESSEAYDTTDGNSTLYLLQKVGATYHAGILQQGEAAAVNQAPEANSVSISGTAQEGETLTGSYIYADNESDPEGASQLQWYRADNGSGLNRAAIAGATDDTYELQTADVGKYIQYGVTPVATSGTTPGTQGLSSYTSAIIAIGANQAPVASFVTISGTAKVGQTLTGSYTYSDNESDAESASIKQWYRADNGSGLNRAAISGATNTTYMLVSGDLGKFIQYSVTPVAATGTSPGSAAVSSYTSAVLENVAPTVVSRIATGPNTIAVTYSEVVNAASSTGNSFSNGGALTISGMTGSGTNTLTFTITETMTNGDTITHTYSGTVVKDTANNNLAAFTNQAVTNSIGTSVTYLTAGPTNGTVTESPSHSFSGGTSDYLVFNEVITGDGSVEVQLGASANETWAIGLDMDNTLQGFTGFQWYLFPFSGKYFTRDSADGDQVDSGISWAAGDFVRISATGTTILAEKSSNNRASWTTILAAYTTARTTSGTTLYIKLAFAAAATAKNVAGVGVS